MSCSITSKQTSKSTSENSVSWSINKLGFDFSLFREHENYDVCIEQVSLDVDKLGWIMHIFDKHKKWEVATL